MRIGIDCRMYSSHFTGIGRYVFELVENLQELDNQNDYYLFFNEPEFNNFQASNPNFHKVLVDVKHYSLAEQTKLKTILNKYDLDLMHFTHFNAPIFYKKPRIVTIHDLTLHFFPGKKMTSFLFRWAYNLTIRAAVKRAKKIIAVSRCTAKDLQEILHTPLKKIHVIYEGVNEDFKEIHNQEVLRHILNRYRIHKPFLLYTGVWRDHKNLKGLLKAFAILRQKHDLQLVITGRKDSVYADETFDTAKKLNLMEENQSAQKVPKVIFPGLISEDELIALINSADIYVFPSFYEGFGLPPLEAMQCGTPVAASNSSCIPEVCGNNAVYFDPHSPEDMAQKIEKLFTDRKLHARLVTSGKKHVEKYSWKRMAKETHQLYLHAARSK
jgi:glycosyltransferase involved in cell wall biosynthesis